MKALRRNMKVEAQPGNLKTRDKPKYFGAGNCKMTYSIESESRRFKRHSYLVQVSLPLCPKAPSYMYKQKIYQSYISSYKRPERNKPIT